jgi:cobalt-zinc-cadmium efflux system outer membrane protein
VRSKIFLGPRGLIVSVLTLAVGVVSGCQSYVARPLDLPSHAAAWRGRTPDDESVQALARRLAASGERSSEFDFSDGLSLDEAGVVALVYNPTLRLARLRAGVAQASAEHAGLWEDPEVGIDLLRIVRGVPNPWIVGSAITLTIPISGRLGVERARAHASMRMLLDRVAEAEWQTQRDLRLAWADWSAVMLRLAETERLVESLESIMQSVLPLVEGGELLRTEASLLAIEGAMRRSELTALRAQAAEAELDIRRLMGLSPGAEVGMVAAIPSLNTHQGAVEQLADTNLTLARLRSEYEVAEGTPVA